MTKGDSVAQPPNGDAPKPYERPTLRKITSNQAILFLTGHAYIRDQGAKELLEFLFPEPVEMTRNGELR
jgi:hypothetical protein